MYIVYCTLYCTMYSVQSTHDFLLHVTNMTSCVTLAKAPGVTSISLLVKTVRIKCIP